MKLNRSALRKIILNEIFGKKLHPLLAAIKKSSNKAKNLKGLEKEFDASEEDWLEKPVEIKKGDYAGRRAVFGQSKSRSFHMARQQARMDGIRKLKLKGTYSGIETPFVTQIDGITYCLVIVPKGK